MTLPPIPANAALSSVVDCEQKIILKRSPKEYLEAVDELNPVEEQGSIRQKKTKLQTNQISYSQTDLEASLIRHKNKPPQLVYKQHISVDNGPARVITACSTTPAAVADEHKLPHLISKANESHGILPKEVGADTKYGTADNYRFLLENQIKPSIPHHGGKNARGLWTKDNFIYDKDKDQYTCPAGYTLKKKGLMKKERQFAYRPHPKHCKSCNYHKKCSNSEQGRSVTRHVHEPSLEKAKQHLKSTQAKTTIQQRSKYVETVFACEKKDLGLNKAKFRGLISVHIESVAELFLTQISANL